MSTKIRTILIYGKQESPRPRETRRTIITIIPISGLNAGLMVATQGPRRRLARLYRQANYKLLQKAQ